MSVVQLMTRFVFRALRKSLKLDYGCWSYSQEGEDSILAQIFVGQKNGFYVDVGAFHPRRFSNTYRFYKMGWRGINIDPTPGSMGMFFKERPRDINLEMGISKNEGLLEFFEFPDPALNTFSRDTAERRGSQFDLISTIQLRAFPLEAVLREWLPKNTEIDFLDVDAEGYDIEVLRSNDWNNFRPKVVLVEVLGSPDLDSALNDPKVAFLASHGYHAMGKTVRTFFFLDEGFLKGLKKGGGFVAGIDSGVHSAN